MVEKSDTGPLHGLRTSIPGHTFYDKTLQKVGREEEMETYHELRKRLVGADEGFVDVAVTWHPLNVKPCPYIFPFMNQHLDEWPGRRKTGRVLKHSKREVGEQDTMTAASALLELVKEINTEDLDKVGRATTAENQKIQHVLEQRYLQLFAGLQKTFGEAQKVWKELVALKGSSPKELVPLPQLLPSWQQMMEKTGNKRLVEWNEEMPENRMSSAKHRRVEDTPLAEIQPCTVEMLEERKSMQHTKPRGANIPVLQAANTAPSTKISTGAPKYRSMSSHVWPFLTVSPQVVTSSSKAQCPLSLLKGSEVSRMVNIPVDTDPDLELRLDMAIKYSMAQSNLERATLYSK